MKKILKISFNFYLIIYICFGWATPIYAQEATDSAQEIASASADLISSIKVPKLPLPFEGKFIISQQFGTLSSGVTFEIKDSSTSDIKAVDEGKIVAIEENGLEKNIRISH